MSARSQWAENLPQPHATILVSLASSWKTHLQIYAIRDEGRVSNQLLAKPNLNKWLSYYRSHRSLTDECMAYFLDEGVDFSQIGTMYGKHDTLTPEELKALMDLISQATSYQSTDEEHEPIPLPMAFFILVWLPCMALYGEYPPILLRKARLGDLDTLCNLIRLDRAVLSDPMIAKFIHSWTMQFHEEKLNKVGQAFAQGLREVKTVKIKLSWAQYVYDLAHSMGMKLETPQIRALFDAIAQDDGLGMHDPDLAKMTDDAFYQALAKKDRKKPLATMTRYRKIKP